MLGGGRFKVGAAIHAWVLVEVNGGHIQGLSHMKRKVSDSVILNHGSKNKDLISKYPTLRVKIFCNRR